MFFRALVVFALACGLAPRPSSAESPLPWAFNAPRADGYSIDLTSADPVPGTPLKAGTSVTFSVKATYTLTAAPHAIVVMVFQDETNKNAAPGAPQQVTEVHDRGGELTLSQTITIPKKAKELRLFIPIVPDGLKETTGELTLRYPITN